MRIMIRLAADSLQVASTWKQARPDKRQVQATRCPRRAHTRTMRRLRAQVSSLGLVPKLSRPTTRICRPLVGADFGRRITSKLNGQRARLHDAELQMVPRNNNESHYSVHHKHYIKYRSLGPL